MKTKQLANVLIKMLGLSAVVHGIPVIFSGLFTVLQATRESAGSFWIFAMLSVIPLVIGIYLVIKSRDVAEYLFKGDDE